jgi:hypothetical protein
MSRTHQEHVTRFDQIRSGCGLAQAQKNHLHIGIFGLEFLERLALLIYVAKVGINTCKRLLVI